MSGWYVLQTKPRREREVALLLPVRGAEEVYLPMVRVGPRPSERPLFPGYVFARLDLETRPTSDFASLGGVRRVVTAEGRPHQVSEETLLLLRSQVESRAAEGWPHGVGFQPGQAVRIRSGPLKDLEGIFEETLDGHQRAVVLLRFLSQASRVSIDVGDLEPVSRSKPPRRTRGRGRFIRHQRTSAGSKPPDSARGSPS